MRVSARRVSHRAALTGLAAAAVTTGAAVLVMTGAVQAASTTLYAAPSGSGSTCSAAQPCTLAGAQALVRSLVAGMAGDIEVQLADGVYRLTSPWRLTAADSGTNGHTVVWRAAPSAHPVISGARAVTGWTVANQAKNIWQASVGTGVDTRQLYVDGLPATRARTQVNRSDFTFTATGMRFTSSALSYLNSLANQNRVELESINSWTDRYSPVQSISGNVLTMRQPAWNNNTFGYDTVSSPFRAGPMYLVNAYEFLDSPGEWYLNPTTGILSYIPRSGQNLASADVELPLVATLVSIGGSGYGDPAHHITMSGITFTGTSWLDPSGDQGYADQQTGAYLAGTWSWPSNALTSCQSGCQQFEATRPYWRQMPAAVQVSAADHVTFESDKFVNLGQTAVGIGNDANAHATGVGLGTSAITVSRSVFAQDSAGAIVAGGVQADAHHPGDQRMINRDLTISNNVVHDMGIDYRGITSFLPTYVTNAVVSHNEIYNMPYSGLSFGYGWGANDAGGSNDYANRGLYNYQPRYTTATTASGNQLTGNSIHDVMQQMNDGACIYTLSANPGARIDGNHCVRTGYMGLYFDEGSRYIAATGNVFDGLSLWAHANYYTNNNTGTLTLTGNWTNTTGIDVYQGDHANTVNSNTTVSGSNWPAGAQAVMAAAGVQPSGDPTSPPSSPPAGGQQLVGAQSGRCLDAPSSTNGTQAQLSDCGSGTGQRFTVTSGKALQVYGSKCLDANGAGTANGTTVIVWDCNGQANQQWNVNSNGTVTGVQSGLCLDANAAGTAAGTKIILWACNGQTNQQWSLRS